MSYSIQNGALEDHASTASALLLESLEIEQFRAFQHLRIPELGRVNLIVGKNSVGKTCLLEALLLYAERASPNAIFQLLEARDEVSQSLARAAYFATSPDEDIDSSYQSVKYLFYGRKDLIEQQAPIQIGPINNDSAKLSLRINWFTEEYNEERLRQLKKVESYSQSSISRLDSEIADGMLPGITVELGSTIVTHLLDRRIFRRRADLQPKPRKIPNFYVQAHRLEASTISRLWDQVTLTDLEKNVLEAVKIVIPQVEAINTKGEKERIVLAKLTGLPEPLPLRSLGEGVTRILGVTLALVNAKNGILLIDEVESGLHYSVQLELWRLIFQTALHLNVQVFATTHSWDCVEAFQKAASTSQEEKGMLIRLQRRGNDIIPTLFNEHKLAIATREQIEIR